jgi:CheY-like chemotaxis protein
MELLTLGGGWTLIRPLVMRFLISAVLLVATTTLALLVPNVENHPTVLTVATLVVFTVVIRLFHSRTRLPFAHRSLHHNEEMIVQSNRTIDSMPSLPFAQAEVDLPYLPDLPADLESFPWASALIVDDSQSARHSMLKILKSHGLRRVETARDGMQAISALKRFVPDIILLDLLMPRMNGLEFLDQISRDPRLRNVPVIVVSSNVTSSDREMATRHGATDFLRKPISETQLWRSIAPIIQRHRITA